MILKVSNNSKSMKKSQKTQPNLSSKKESLVIRKLIKVIIELTLARLKDKLMLRTEKSSPHKLNVSTLSKLTSDTRKFATGVEPENHQPPDGDGSPMTASGTDTMMASGTTGAHPRLDSLMVTGNGTRATGIIMDMYSNMLDMSGTDSKVVNGSNMDPKFQLDQASQEVQESADLSMFSRSGDSQHLLQPKNFLSAKLEVVKEPYTICGRAMPHADSLEEDSSTPITRLVRSAKHINGSELSDV